MRDCESACPDAQKRFGKLRSLLSPICERLFAAVLALSLASGCAWSRDVDRQRDQNLQQHHGSALLEGYTEFRTVMFDGDSSMAWLEFRLPESTDVRQATSLIADRIRGHDRCFQATELGAEEARLRCQEGQARHFREYLVAVFPQERKVLLMYASVGTEAELIGYTAAVKDFREEVQSRRR
jgi:hypothetical protein